MEEEDIYTILSRALKTHTQISIDPNNTPDVEQAQIQPQQCARESQQIVIGDKLPETANNMTRYEQDINDFIAAKSRDFDKLIPTTFGLNGGLTNVVFDESILIKHIGPFLTYPCVRAVCNDGTVSIADFDERVKTGQIDMSAAEKAERQHIKKQERLHNKTRKIHGDGKSFNSSILFWIHSAKFGIVYKIRLFRNGRFGLPGTRPDMIDDIINLRDHVLIPILARSLHVAYNLPTTPQIVANELVPIMKNYKWRRIMPENAIINLRAVISRVRNNTSNYPFPPFNVAYAQYGIDDSKLSIKFITPVSDKPNKSIRIKMFPSGKINILGAHCSEITKKICEYIITILDDTIIVANTCCGDNFSEIEDSPGSDCEFPDEFDRKFVEDFVHHVLPRSDTSYNLM